MSRLSRSTCIRGDLPWVRGVSASGADRGSNAGVVLGLPLMSYPTTVRRTLRLHGLPRSVRRPAVSGSRSTRCVSSGRKRATEAWQGTLMRILKRGKVARMRWPECCKMRRFSKVGSLTNGKARGWDKKMMGSPPFFGSFLTYFNEICSSDCNRVPHTVFLISENQESWQTNGSRRRSATE